LKTPDLKNFLLNLAIFFLAKTFFDLLDYPAQLNVAEAAIAARGNQTVGRILNLGRRLLRF